MSSLVSLVFNIELSLIIAIVTSFVLGFLLLLIKVPNTDYSRKIAETKNTIAVCFFICTALFYTTLRYSGIPDYEMFASLMMFVVTAISSAILSFSLINLLDENHIDGDKFYLNVGLVAALSFLLVKSFWWDEGWMRTAVMIGCIVLFIIQCVSHIITFNSVYIKSRHQIEQYYDDEEDQKLKWIRFCYAIMMLTQMFVLVYMLFPMGWMKVYTFFYSLFMLYFCANFISFLGSHKLLLDAFAYKTLSGQDLMEKLARNRRKNAAKDPDEAVRDINDNEFRRLERSLARWVEEKRYCEYDRSREEIAKELHTSKEVLHMYFATRKGVDFRTWRTELRIEEAKRMLLENRDMSTHIIGELAGFSDRANFHRQFVKLVGCSPKQWRESGGNPAQF
ncbi:MAG: AraC family transcriptional regulator [Bacteroidales bacterium]|nr:AraC family transcriptional regulator [Bacteroidales bacterium]